MYNLILQNRIFQTSLQSRTLNNKMFLHTLTHTINKNRAPCRLLHTYRNKITFTIVYNTLLKRVRLFVHYCTMQLNNTVHNIVHYGKGAFFLKWKLLNNKDVHNDVNFRILAKIKQFYLFRNQSKEHLQQTTYYTLPKKCLQFMTKYLTQMFSEAFLHKTLDSRRLKIQFGKSLCTCLSLV